MQPNHSYTLTAWVQGTYAFIGTGHIGTDAIRVGMIYKPSRVMPVGPFATLDSTDDPRFLDTKNRPSLAQSFEVLSTGALSGVLARAQAHGVNFAVSLAAKDLGLAVGKAGDAPVAAAALAVVRAAIDQHAKEDVAVLANL